MFIPWKSVDCFSSSLRMSKDSLKSALAEMGLLYVIDFFANYFSKDKIFWNTPFQSPSKLRNKAFLVKHAMVCTNLKCSCAMRLWLLFSYILRKKIKDSYLRHFEIYFTFFNYMWLSGEVLFKTLRSTKGKRKYF